MKTLPKAKNPAFLKAVSTILKAVATVFATYFLINRALRIRERESDAIIASFVGYIDVPYCHGMTIGELARYFNERYKVNCKLTVIPMKGWKRSMSFRDTGLHWVPPSPQIPEDDTPYFYPTTGLLGELQVVSIGVGYTLPFKLVGAPWMDAERFAKHLNKQAYPGVFFKACHFRPFYGRFRGKICQGVQIIITNTKKYLPVSTQYLIIGMIKSLYPKEFTQALEKSKDREEMFNKVNGNKEVYRLVKNERFIVWKLRAIDKEKREAFKKERKAYLLRDYED